MANPPARSRDNALQSVRSAQDRLEKFHKIPRACLSVEWAPASSLASNAASCKLSGALTAYLTRADKAIFLPEAAEQDTTA